MNTQTVVDPKGNEVQTIHLNVFGYQIWLQSNTGKQFIRNCRLVNRIDRKARRAKHQLMEIQKLMSAINDEYHA